MPLWDSARGAIPSPFFSTSRDPSTQQLHFGAWSCQGEEHQQAGWRRTGVRRGWHHRQVAFIKLREGRRETRLGCSDPWGVLRRYQAWGQWMPHGGVWAVLGTLQGLLGCWGCQAWLYSILMYGDKDGVTSLLYEIIAPHTFKDYISSLCMALFGSLCWGGYPLLLLGPHQNPGLWSINLIYIIFTSKQAPP